MLAVGTGLPVAKIVQMYAVSRDQAYRWRHRLAELIATFTTGLPAEKELRAAIDRMLNDRQRPGAPLIYSTEDQCAIVNIALAKPDSCGRPIEEWTARELADEVNKRNFFTPTERADKRLRTGRKTISARTIGRLLDEAKVKPHKSKYWENPTIDDPVAHQRRIETINHAYRQAGTVPGTHVISIDEKTGIQALERIHPDKPRLPGMPALLEFEYRRHGTLAIIPSFDVASGKIIGAHINTTRTEIDFCSQIAATIDTSPDDTWIFIADQLNTHKSVSLVKMIAERIGDQRNLGIKGKEGILKTRHTRQTYLEDPAHRIHFIFTPKHCSWMNQIEIWFSILSRKALRRASFSSLDELKERMKAFINYFNATMARPFNWTYTGRILQ